MGRYGCDFSTQLRQDILKAQQSVDKQEYSIAVIQYLGLLERNLPAKIKTKIYYQLAELYHVRLGKFQKGLAYYKKVKDSSIDPQWQVKAEEKIADINFQFLKEFNEASRSYHRLVRFRPKLQNHDTYEYKYGVSLIEAGQLEKALNLFINILKNQNHEHFHKSLFQMGIIYFQKKEWNNSLEHFKLYLKSENDPYYISLAKFLMANIYETIEELEVAYDLYYSTLSIYPNTEVIKSRLKSLYARRVARKR